MKSNKFILFLIVIFIVIACKKQELQEPEYLLERDNETNAQSVNSSTYTGQCTAIYAMPALASINNDSLFGYIICNRPLVGNVVSKNSAFISVTEAEVPANMDTTGLNYHDLKDYNVYNNPNDSSLVIFEFSYKNKLYKVYSSLGFSNCIFDTKVSNFNKYSKFVPYHIKFDGPIKNTDAIFTCGPTIKLTDTLAILKTCTSVANFGKDERIYSISFINTEYFTIEGRRFVLYKYATHSFSFY